MKEGVRTGALYTGRAERARISFFVQATAPQTALRFYPEHDIFIQLMKLKNMVRNLCGEDLTTPLGDHMAEKVQLIVSPL
jgi:hypothetical protein